MGQCFFVGWSVFFVGDWAKVVVSLQFIDERRRKFFPLGASRSKRESLKRNNFNYFLSRREKEKILRVRKRRNRDFQTVFLNKASIIIFGELIGRMYKTTPLSMQQIEELRMELTKLLQQNMDTFSGRLSSSEICSSSFDVDTLFQFSSREFQKMSQTICNISQFTFTVLDNFVMLWEEVQYRDNKISELRKTFSETTSFIEELRCENEDIKNKLSQAETYIQWIEQQKQYLDAIYDSSTNGPVTKTAMSRCVSQSQLRWSRPKNKSVNYQKLKDYIESMKSERAELQSELIKLTKRYQIKSEQCKKANFIIEHLFEALNKKHQFRECSTYFNSSKQNSKTELTSEEMLKMLEKLENISSTTSLENHLQMYEQRYQVNEPYHYFQSYSHLTDFGLRECPAGPSHFGSSFHERETKDAEICTQSELLNNHTVETQTDNKQNVQKENNTDFKISIHISGLEDNRNARLEKIIKELDLQQQLQSKLQKKMSKDQEKGQSGRTAGKKVSLFDYYCKRLISNRIKKYYFKKPDSLKIDKNVK